MIVAVCVVKVRECVGCGDGRVGGRKLQNCYCFALRVTYIISMNIITVDWRLELRRTAMLILPVPESSSTSAQGSSCSVLLPSLE